MYSSAWKKLPTFSQHADRYALDVRAYERWIFGPDSPVWLMPKDGLLARRVALHPVRNSPLPPSPYSASLCAEFHDLPRHAVEAIFHLQAQQQCTIRDGCDLLLSGCHFRYNWEEFLRSTSGGEGNLALPTSQHGFTDDDRALAARALWELFRAGTCAALRPPPVSFGCGTRWNFDRPYLLGILNVTPDSFSDGGCYVDPDAAVAHAMGMVLDGADALDLGAESSRPGSRGVSSRAQKARLLPVIRRLRKRRDLGRIPIGIDTQSAEVFRACLGEGADLLNDISALRHDRDMARLVARTGCPAILMHMLGTPRTMQDNPRYGDVVDDIATFFATRIHAVLDKGVAPTRVLLDPGIGFGKTLEHNCELLRRLSEFRAMGRPLVVGASRKSFLGTLTGESLPYRRVQASVTAGVLAVHSGAAVLRVHDVAEHAQSLRVANALSSASS
jgi:dihydropteroate synthase